MENKILYISNFKAYKVVKKWGHIHVPITYHLFDKIFKLNKKRVTLEDEYSIENMNFEEMIRKL